MAYRKRRTTTTRRRRVKVSRKLQKTRKLVGQPPVTRLERIAAGIGPIAQIAQSAVQLASFINSEKKFKDTDLAGTLNNTPSYALALNGLAEGDDVNQRNGRSVLDKAIQIKSQIQLNLSNGAVNRIGMAVILDKKPEVAGATVPVWTTVFSSGDPTALISQASSDRFVILKRWVMGMEQTTTVVRNLDYYQTLTGIHTKYDGTTAGYDSIDQNAIILMGTSDQGTDPPTIVGTARYTYYDN